MNDQRDPYLIPGTDVFRNKLGITDGRTLATAEYELSTARTIEILGDPRFKAEGTVEQLQRIHRHLFQDVYDWAGQIRTVDIHKSGGVPFQPIELFREGARYAEETLRGDHMLTGMDHDTFIRRLSINYDDFNVLHPFREGNGRTQRVFWTSIARQAGWEIDWTRATKEQIADTSKAAMMTGNRRPLENMFDQITARHRNSVRTRRATGPPPSIGGLEPPQHGRFPDSALGSMSPGPGAQGPDMGMGMDR
ncbi:Fic/DOC family protein [Bifidobacterium favimelis]|uniref:protein adenylyltransferase n=1 Tax=Bifidobacterium favimelis TaxID=3122979 RepID=A0ABU8ZL64_9BIFI